MQASRGPDQPRRRGSRGRPRQLSRSQRRELGLDGAPPREPRDRAGHAWAAALFVLLGLGIVVGGAYAALYGLAHDRVPRNTTIGGISVGGLSAGDARAVLDRDLAGAGNRPIEILADGLDTTIVPSTAGLSYDAALSVQRAGGTSSRDPRVLLRELFAAANRQKIVVRLDPAALARATAAVAQRYDQPVREGSVSFAGTQVQTVNPLPGRMVDPTKLGQALTIAFQERESTLTASVVIVNPKTTDAGVRAAAARLAGPALSGPVRLSTSSGSVLLAPARFVPALRMTADAQGRFVLGVDVPTLRTNAGPQLALLGVTPRSATIRVVGNRAVVVPATVGEAVPDAALAAGLRNAVLARGAARSVTLTRAPVQPAVPTAQLADLHISAVISTFTATFANRIGFNANIARAAASLQGRIVAPGDQLSFNTTVGQRTPQRGFVPGIVIVNGRYGRSVGGGVAVAATALFNAAYFAGWAVPERQAPGVYSGTAPDGRDATVAYGSIDLVLDNTSPYGGYLQTAVVPATAQHPGSLTVRIFSTRWFSVAAGISARSGVSDPGTATGSKAAGCVPSTGVPGFSVLVTRTVRRGETIAESDARTVTYTSLPTVSCD